MRFFFRTRQFKIILAVFLVITIASLTFAIAAHRMSPLSDAAGVITAPFKNAFTAVSNSVKDFFRAYNDGNELMIENSKLQKEINELRKKVADYENTKNQNDFYSKYLGIKEKNPAQPEHSKAHGVLLEGHRGERLFLQLVPQALCDRRCSIPPCGAVHDVAEGEAVP